ncbi:cysteine desulfurase family protein [Bacillus smithii]|jgi:cysteine desulfurase|uniref:cysteine desulfurase family protein n=1 Tax=Bacillus smithii TaxID=1479 RepID=UPI0022E1BBFC|nr:cysteine desulfurase family protein [Bacillus smithii]
MIYFDNSATTKPYKEVMESFLKINENFYANPSSLHSFGGQAEKLLTEARKQIASLLRCKPSEVFFTSGGTESNNLAIKGTALQYRHRGNHIITTSIEHPSVHNACKQLEDLGFEVTYLPVDKNGMVRVEDVEKAIRPETILVSVMHVNNEIGSIQPVEEIGKLLKNFPKIFFHVDHVQGAGKIPLPLSDGIIDFCSISAHKFHGLKGTGILYIKEGIRISPLFSGGSQEKNVRSGTENTGGIVAMAKALRMTMEKQKTALKEMENIRRYLFKSLRSIEDVTIYSPDSGAPHIINFAISGVRGEVLVHALESKGIFLSTTSACSSRQNQPSRTLLAMGVPEKEADFSVRISLSYENTMEEAKEFITTLKELLPTITKTKRR